MRVLIGLLFAVALASCDTSVDEPAVPAVPYEVRYQATTEGDGRIDSLKVTYTGPNLEPVTFPPDTFGSIDRTIQIPPGVTAAIEFTGVCYATPGFPAASIIVQIDATRDGMTLTDRDVVTVQSQGREGVRIQASASVPLPLDGN